VRNVDVVVASVGRVRAPQIRSQKTIGSSPK